MIDQQPRGNERVQRYRGAFSKCEMFTAKYKLIDSNPTCQICILSNTDTAQLPRLELI